MSLLSPEPRHFIIKCSLFFNSLFRKSVRERERKSERVRMRERERETLRQPVLSQLHRRVSAISKFGNGITWNAETVQERKKERERERERCLYLYQLFICILVQECATPHSNE
jgi:hypothetical protein